MKVLIVIDMQNDFIDGSLGTKEAVAIVPNVAKKIAKARAAGEAVLFTRDTHQKNYLESQEGKNLPVLHCVEGSDGWQISSKLEVGDSRIFNKPSFGSMELADYVAILSDLEEIDDIKAYKINEVVDTEKSLISEQIIELIKDELDY